MCSILWTSHYSFPMFYLAHVLKGKQLRHHTKTMNTKYHTRWELSITIVLDRQQHTGDSKTLKEHIVIDFAERKLSQCTSITEIKVEETIRRLCVICIITLNRQNSFSLYKNLQRPLKIIDTVTQVVFLKWSRSRTIILRK
jgi:hypothetical protein